MRFRRVHGPAGLVRHGFTLVELLVAMATIVTLMAILSQAFVMGIETFRRMKGIGDLNERMRTAVFDLRREVLDAGRATTLFVVNALRTRSYDVQAAAALHARYLEIVTDAEDLDTRLRVLEQQPVNPAARRVLRQAMDALDRVRLLADRMAALIEMLPPPPRD